MLRSVGPPSRLPASAHSDRKLHGSGVTERDEVPSATGLPAETRIRDGSTVAVAAAEIHERYPDCEVLAATAAQMTIAAAIVVRNLTMPSR